MEDIVLADIIDIRTPYNDAELLAYKRVLSYIHQRLVEHKYIVETTSLLFKDIPVQKEDYKLFHSIGKHKTRLDCITNNLNWQVVEFHAEPDGVPSILFIATLSVITISLLLVALICFASGEIFGGVLLSGFDIIPFFFLMILVVKRVKPKAFKVNLRVVYKDDLKVAEIV